MNGKVVIDTELNTKRFDAQIEEIEDKLNDIDILLSKPKELGSDEFIKLNSEAEKLRNRLKDLVDKRDELNKPPTMLKDYFSDMGNSLRDNIKKVERLVLGIFGIRGAYMAVRNAVNVIANDDAQLKADIDYMKNILAYSLEPIVRWIVDLAKQLVFYIGYIVKAWFNVDIFAKSNAKSLKQGVGYAKEMRKQLAGFDEMNILQAPSSTSGGGGVETPDFSGFGDQKIPKWLEWIAKNKEAVIGFLGTIATIIGTIKLAKLYSALKQMFPILQGITKLQLLGLLTGIAIAIVGIYETITSIVAYIGDPTWSNFNKILGGISTTLVGIGITMVALNLSNPLGWLVIALGIVVNYAKEISNVTRILIEGKAQILSTKEAQDQLNKSKEDALLAENEYAYAIDRSEEAQRRLKELEEQAQISGEELYNSVRKGTIDYKNMTDQQKEVYKAYLDNLSAEQQVTTATENLINKKEIEKQKSWENQLALAKETGNYEDFRDAVVKAYEDGSLSADEARDLIERAMSKIDSKTNETFAQNIPNEIRDGLNPDKYRTNAWDLVNVINGILGHINLGLGAGASTFASGVRKIFGFAKGGIVVPKLASGGIINQPSRGVPIGSAIGGEHGMEGVIPLTDSQQMELLGSAIGRYITINASITNTMNGKVISRELKRVQNEDDFAFNK